MTSAHARLRLEILCKCAIGIWLLLPAGCNDSHRTISAAWRDDIADVKAGLAAGELVDAQDDDGRTAIWIAAYRGNDEICRLLLDLGANVEIPDKYLGPPLHAASESGHASTVSILLAAGANLESRQRHGMTALWHAVRKDRLETVKALVHAGADVNALNSLGSSPLHVAAELNNVSIMNFLLVNGADTEQRDGMQRSPLHRAVMHDNLAAAKSLLKCGANIDAVDKNGCSILQVAKDYRASTELIYFLKQAIDSKRQSKN